MSEAETTRKTTEQEQQPFLPPATFEFLLFSLRTQVEMNLGLMHFGPEDQRPEPDFGLARHGIDLLGMLQEKTRGNLSMDEKRLLENSLTELRFRYVQAVEEQKRRAAAPAETGEAGTGEAGAGEAGAESSANSESSKE
jgi:hypothetical protein